ncbi:MAG: AAA family ATPase [Desulfobacteraceae bacterium]|nr:AAA family ATPase [Desulfobacteraceae bacterium]
MIIKKISLSNYRGARSLDLELNKTMNVFMGVNGAGKSTILDASAIMLSWFVSRLKHSGTSGRPITENDITNGTSTSSIELDCIDNGQRVAWKLVRRRKSYMKIKEKSDFSALNNHTKQMQSMIEERQENLNLPLCAYYPVNRSVLDIPLRIRKKHKFNLFASYDDALTSGANFRTFFEWFREREDLENENRKYKNALFKPDDFQFPDTQLETVRRALDEFLPEFNNLTVRRNPLRMEINKKGKTLSVAQLSDGEKCLIAIVGDLARRLAIANPKRKNPLEGRGIVIIDEIDLHLHPKWQRRIISTLGNVFINIQFIVSTHSPHVITHVQPEATYLLSMMDQGIVFAKPLESYGKNVDRVLEDLMGLETTRPDVVNKLLTKLYETISDGKLDAARKQAAYLRDMIGEDSEIAKAMVLIKRHEILGK